MSNLVTGCNMDIRILIFANGLKHYKIAKMLGIGETTFCRMLRKELSIEKKEEIKEVINKLKMAE